MADVTILGVTYEDILQKLRGTNVADFAEPGTDAAGQAALETHLKAAWSYIKQRLPYKYRRFLTNCPGETFRRCQSNQTTFTLSLDVATDNSNLIVYANPTWAWNRRSRDDGYDDDDVSLSSQVVTIAMGVAEDDTIVIEYDHDGTCLTPSGDEDDYGLQTALVNVAAFMAGREHFSLQDEDMPVHILSYKEESDEYLAMLMDGSASIPVLDDVEVWEDWKGPARGVRSHRGVRG